MKRRTSFRAAFGCMIATIAGRCVAFGETAKFYWPGRWKEDSLRQHLMTDTKHGFTEEQLGKLTYQDCLDLHDWHHSEKLGHKTRTPYPGGRQIEDTGTGRGETNKPDDKSWADFMGISE